MARTIIRLNDWYLIWSEIVDAPIACCKEDQLSDAIAQFFTSNPSVIERLVNNLRLTGSSSLIGSSASAIIAGNCAGPRRQSLTSDEIYRAYCLQERINGWSPYDDEGHNPT